MSDELKTAILKQYEESYPLLCSFTERVEKLLKDLLSGHRWHSITSRTKTRSSLQDKLGRPNSNYRNITDVTDLCGVRITTYFPDEVDKIAEIVEKEFDIDKENSVDKRAVLDPDRFGYLSVHYVAKLSPARLQLTENRQFHSCRMEIQVRSILQHTWAEIEHDLGYKTTQAVPKTIRRRFFRLAGLLEIADNEFASIRDALSDYKKEVPGLLNRAPQSVPIDQTSLLIFIGNSRVVSELDTAIATMARGRLLKPTDQFSNTLVQELKFVGLETMADLESRLVQFRDKILGLGQPLMGERAEIYAGISIFYVCYVMAARDGGRDQLLALMNTVGVGLASERPKFAEKIMELYARLNAGSKD